MAGYKIGNKISLFAWVDVLISALVLFVFIAMDKAKVATAKKVIAIVATCTIGVSCGLPLYLYFREQVDTV